MAAPPPTPNTNAATAFPSFDFATSTRGSMPLDVDVDVDGDAVVIQTPVMSPPPPLSSTSGSPNPSDGDSEVVLITCELSASMLARENTLEKLAQLAHGDDGDGGDGSGGSSKNILSVGPHRGGNNVGNSPSLSFADKDIKNLGAMVATPEVSGSKTHDAIPPPLPMPVLANDSNGNSISDSAGDSPDPSPSTVAPGTHRRNSLSQTRFARTRYGKEAADTESPLTRRRQLRIESGDLKEPERPPLLRITSGNNINATAVNSHVDPIEEASQLHPYSPRTLVTTVTARRLRLGGGTFISTPESQKRSLSRLSMRTDYYGDSRDDTAAHDAAFSQLSTQRVMVPATHALALGIHSGAVSTNSNESLPAAASVSATALRASRTPEAQFARLADHSRRLSTSVTLSDGVAVPTPHESASDFNDMYASAAPVPANTSSGANSGVHMPGDSSHLQSSNSLPRWSVSSALLSKDSAGSSSSNGASSADSYGGITDSYGNDGNAVAATTKSHFFPASTDVSPKQSFLQIADPTAAAAVVVVGATSGDGGDDAGASSEGATSVRVDTSNAATVVRDGADADVAGLDSTVPQHELGNSSIGEHIDYADEVHVRLSVIASDDEPSMSRSSKNHVSGAAADAAGTTHSPRSLVWSRSTHSHSQSQSTSGRSHHTHSHSQSNSKSVTRTRSGRVGRSASDSSSTDDGASLGLGKGTRNSITRGFSAESFGSDGRSSRIVHVEQHLSAAAKSERSSGPPSAVPSPLLAVTSHASPVSSKSAASTAASNKADSSLASPTSTSQSQRRKKSSMLFLNAKSDDAAANSAADDPATSASPAKKRQSYLHPSKYTKVGGVGASAPATPLVAKKQGKLRSLFSRSSSKKAAKKSTKAKRG
jgi:hypothetical protein